MNKMIESRKKSPLNSFFSSHSAVIAVSRTVRAQTQKQHISHVSGSQFTSLRAGAMPRILGIELFVSPDVIKIPIVLTFAQKTKSYGVRDYLNRNQLINKL